MHFVAKPTIILLVLALGLMLLTPAAAQDGIDLVPFSSDTFGVEGVLPAGWSEVGPGVYARGAGAADLTSLIIQAAPGMTAEALTNVLLRQLGIASLPDSTGTLATEAYTWTLYAIDVAQAGLNIRVDLALAEDDRGVTLVLLQTLADEYNTLHDAVFLPVVEALAPLGAGAGEAGAETPAEESVYRDPDGRFSVPIPTNWRVDAREGYVVLASPDDLITVSFVVVETDDVEEALAQAWAVVDADFDRAVADTLDIPVSELDRFVLYTYEMADGDDTIVQAEVRVHQGVAYVGLFNANLTAAQQRQAQIQIIDSGFNIAAIEATDLSDVEPLPLSDALIAELEAYIQAAMESYQTPGAAVAIVRDGEIVYASGFGVRNPQGDPVTPETRMLIGSTTKTMTTLLMAQLVDEGVMAWDTPVIEILPTFRVADPEATGVINMEHMVCACTGVPRRDLELIFNSDELTAEGIIESLSTFTFFTDFGEAFQYSNQMVAAAGYLAALAAGGSYGTLYNDYVTLVETRIFEPLGMEGTTFSFDEALASDNYALPYGLYMDFTFEPLPFEVEQAFLIPITPAGAAWSTALDMAQYMIMMLNEGVAADGTRIVSADNLARTWEPQVAISASDEYGLGWIVSDYHGLTMLSHAGNTLGFTSEFAFLPERDLGIVVLTNQRLSPLNSAVRTRLFEMLFEQPHSTEEVLQFQLNLMRDQYAKILEQIERTAEPEAIDIAVGAYTNEALGDVTIRRSEDGVLIFDAGEFRSELWRYMPEDKPDTDTIHFLLYDPPLNGLGVRFEAGDDGDYRMIVGEGVNEYSFERAG